MERVGFNKCLNKEIKFYNVQVGALVGTGIFGIVAWGLKGLMYGFGAAVIGFFVGRWIWKEYWLGNLQRWSYWNLPSTGALFGKRLPPSHQRHLL
jgi:hypothetical protein